MRGNGVEKKSMLYIKNMDSLSLYNYFRSSTSYRVRIALEIKGLKYTYIPVHLLNNGGEQNTTEYRKLNPAGGVPSLQHNGKIISQSFAIIDYLESMFPEPALFPKDHYQSGKIRQFCETVNSDIHPLTNLKVMKFLETDFAFSTEQKVKWISKWVTDGLLALEKIVAPQAGLFCFGDTLTAADLFLIPQLFSANRFQVDISKFENLSRINEACLKKEAFAKAHPHRQSDTPEELRLPALS